MNAVNPKLIKDFSFNSFHKVNLDKVKIIRYTFDNPASSNRTKKLVIFIIYLHLDCVRKIYLNTFIEHYQNWYKRKKYNFSKSKLKESMKNQRNLFMFF